MNWILIIEVFMALRCFQAFVEQLGLGKSIDVLLRFTKISLTYLGALILVQIIK